MKHVTQFLLVLGAGVAFVGRQRLLGVGGDEFDQVKAPDDAPTVGLLLCKTKNTLVAEYALRSSTSPIGVSEYRLVESLPKDLEASLPSIARIEEELSKLPTPRSRSEKRRGKKTGKE